jgi:hypothetical protein
MSEAHQPSAFSGLGFPALQPRSGERDFSPAFSTLVVTQSFARNVRLGFQPANAGESVKPRVQRVSAQPWEHWRKPAKPAKAGGRAWPADQCLSPTAWAWKFNLAHNLGFRLRLHPRLYALVITHIFLV